MASLRIADIADVLHPRSSRWRALALLVAYFDESGTHERSPITAIGGFVASKAAWEVFETDLAAVLAPYADKGVREFHMTDCLAQEGQYAFIARPHINAILWGIGRALKKAEVTAVYAAVVQDDWDEVVTDGPFRDRFPTTYALCFEEVAVQLARWSRKYGDGEPVVPIFAIADQYQEQATNAAAAMDRSNRYAGYLSGIAFNRPQVLTPLQAADFAAHSLRGNMENLVYWESFEKAQPTVVFDHATRGKFAHGGCHTKESLLLAIDRFNRTGES